MNAKFQIDHSLIKKKKKESHEDSKVVTDFKVQKKFIKFLVVFFLCCSVTDYLDVRS